MIFLEVLKDACLDTVRLLPFLFGTYLVMEYLEQKAEEHSEHAVKHSGAKGPLLGAALGVVPQCGFSTVGASLFSGGVISLGTLISIFLSTSDEMIPVFISEAVKPSMILKILVCKFAMAAAAGFAVDGINRLLRNTRGEGRHKDIHDLCEQEHCHCAEEHSIWKSALHHTSHIAIFIFLLTLMVGMAMKLVGQDAMGSFLTARPVLGVLLAALVGMIPNCASSVVVTELYLSNILGAGQMIAGLLAGAGVGVLVLFRTNRNLKENLGITLMLYCISVGFGLLIEGLGITF